SLILPLTLSRESVERGPKRASARRGLSAVSLPPFVGRQPRHRLIAIACRAGDQLHRRRQFSGGAGGGGDAPDAQRAVAAGGEREVAAGVERDGCYRLLVAQRGADGICGGD